MPPKPQSASRAKHESDEGEKGQVPSQAPDGWKAEPTNAQGVFVLTQKYLKEVLSYSEETGVFTWAKRKGHAMPGDVAGTNFGQGYIGVQIDGRRYQAHRLAWLYVFGAWPNNEIDHIDGVRNNNAIANLRDVTHRQNIQNKRKATSGSRSGLIGAHFKKYKNKWSSCIACSGKRIHIGYFDSAIKAHEAYIAAKRELHPFGTL